MSRKTASRLIFVTEPEYRKGEAVFRRPPSGFLCRPAPATEAALAAAVRQHQAYAVIVGTEPYTGPLYAALPRGGVIARFGVGHDGIAKPLATRQGLFCTNTPGTLARSVAEHTLGLLLAAARGIPAVAAACADGAWTPRLGSELHGQTLAVIGCGRIGCRVAHIASAGFGMRVIGGTRRVTNEALLKRKFGFARVTDHWSDAVRKAAFVSLHIPSLPETRRFVNAARLAALPPHAWLINTARGAILDEAALYDALAGGRLAGAALDVFEREPYAPADPARDLRRLPNVLMTPHIGSSTAEACARVAARCLAQIEAVAAGRTGALALLNPAVRTA